MQDLPRTSEPADVLQKRLRTLLAVFGCLEGFLRHAGSGEVMNRIEEPIRQFLRSVLKRTPTLEEAEQLIRAARFPNESTKEVAE